MTTVAQDWQRLGRCLAWQYPADWEERFFALREGTAPDLIAWRSIGGEAVPARVDILRPAHLPKTIDDANRAQALRRQGQEVPEIAGQLDCTPSHVYRLLRMPLLASSLPALEVVH